VRFRSQNNHQLSQGNTREGKRTHRGKRNNNRHKIDKLKILTINIRGIKSKTNTLENTLLTHGTHIAGITETHLSKGEKINIKGYKWVGKERKDKQGGGIGFLIRNDIANLTETTEPNPNHSTETLWLKLKTRNPMHIGITYGKQENTQVEEIEEQFNELTTQINQLKTKGEVILMGDFNAKVNIDRPTYRQEESRNGTKLETMINNTQMVIINTKETHTGTWTRVNRNNPQEKSIIDYILATQNTAKHIIESMTDDIDLYIIKGKNRTDHNVITAKVRTDTKQATKKIKRWKRGTGEQWDQFNKQLTTEWNKLNETMKTYQNLDRIIKTTLRNTVGEITINPNQKRKVNNEEIKMAKQSRKTAKKTFQMACKTGNHEQIKYNKDRYVKAQRKVSELIKKETNQRTTLLMEKIIAEGGANSNTFWNIRKKLTANKDDNYDTLDDDNNTITDPEKTKEHIANYFEKLYRAREGEQTHEDWTDHINETVNNIEYSTRNCENTSINPEELDQAINQLKKGKSCGPDNIPNEALIYANEDTRKILLETINNIQKEETIPKQWTEGEIIRLYRGKGKKGRCDNERGITLSSNLGKLFERIINNRVTPEITSTESQGGGKKGKATADHIVIINSAIQENKRKKKNKINIVFLDVTKAYDKAWLNAILYTLYNSGITGKNWRLIKKLNENLTAKIQTKHGLTKEIQIKDSIRQGGVLSVVEYSNLMDDITKNIQDKEKGQINIGNHTITGCLLWMDDVALIHNDTEELQHMLNITNETAKRYHIKFGTEKSQTLTLGKTKPQLKLGEDILETTNKYKYLGIIMNDKGNMDDHIQALKGKTEAALQTILNIAGYDDFNGIQMEIIWKLTKTCIIPILTYAAEAWIPNKSEINKIQLILENTIKRILDAPRTTPKDALALETGIWNIESLFEQKQLQYYHRILTRTNTDTMLYKITTDPETQWNKNIQNIMNKYNITENQMISWSKYQAKKTIKIKIEQKLLNNITERSGTKTKTKDLLEGKPPSTRLETPSYINRLTRRDCRNIFNTRTRMIKIKDNFRGTHTDLTCRWCKNKPETQEHIFTECEPLREYTENIDYHDLMKNQANNASTYTKKLAKLLQIINETQTCDASGNESDLA